MENGDAFVDKDPGPTYADAFPPLTSSAFRNTIPLSVGNTLPTPESSWPIKPIPTSTATQVSTFFLL